MIKLKYHKFFSGLLLSFFLSISGSPGFAQQPKITSYSVNTLQVLCFEKFEITIDQFQANYSNPFNPNEIRIHGLFTSPHGRGWDIPGFFDGQKFRIRFSPDRVGQWQFHLKIQDANGSSETEADQFTCLPSGHHGRIQVSPFDPHYLAYSDSTVFVGIGQCLPWYLERYPQFWELMKENGGNIFVYWIPAWDHSLLYPNDYQHYNTFNARKIDTIIELCEQNDIHIIFTIWNHDWLRDDTHQWRTGNSWPNNPFRLITPQAKDFFTDPYSWHYQKKYYQYIIARWGYSRAIAAWQTITEIDGTNAFDNTDTWHKKLNDYFKANDPFAHPTTASKSGDKYWAAGNEVMDLPQMHAYNSMNSPYWIAKDIASYTRQMWKQVAKPNFMGEFGHPENDGMQPTHLHNAIWAALANGAAIMPLDWNDGSGWPYMSTEMYHQLKNLSIFVNSFDIQKLALQPMAIKRLSLIDAWGMLGENAGFGWLLKINPSTSAEGMKLTITVDNTSRYAVRWFDTWSGKFTKTEYATAENGILQLPLSDFDRDIAFFIYKQRKEFEKEDFQGGLIGWEIVTPEWNIVNGALRGTAQNDTEALILSGSEKWRNYTIEFDARLEPASEGYVVLRDREGSGYYAQFSETHVSMGKYSPESKTMLQQKEFHLSTNNWHRLTFTAMNCQLNLVLDGQVVFQLSDPSFREGGIGFGVVHGSVCFDNVRIIRDATPPAKPVFIDPPEITDAKAITLSGTKSADTDSMSITLDDVPMPQPEFMNDTLWRVNVNPLHVGINVIKAVAFDPAGNASAPARIFLNRYSGQLLFYDNFDKLDTAKWQSINGQWVADSGYVQETSWQDKTFLIFDRTPLDQFTLSVRVYFPQPKIIYLPFNWQDIKNHYRIRIKINQDDDDQIKIERILNGTYTVLAEAYMELQNRGWPRWVACLLDVRRGKMKFYLDRDLVLSASDSTIQFGKVGIGAHRLIARFDDFMVFKDEMSQVKESTSSPARYSLEQNYPNPFNPATTIRFTIPAKEFVRLDLYNTLGEKIRTLVHQGLQPGEHTVVWDGRDDAGAQVSAGLYFCRLRTSHFESIKKLILAK